jgi:Sulfotransferase domain
MIAEETPRPNLFVVGAMKSGTTTLHNHLSCHPDIFMSKKKEPSFFSRSPSKENILSYLSLFADGSGKTYIGESSTEYTKSPRIDGIAHLIHEFCQNAKIIYIMRDPVERAISHYWWDVEFSAEGRPMLEAIHKIPEINSVSDYATQIRPYIEQFGRENVYALTFEEMSQDPHVAMTALFKWLRLDPLKAKIVSGRRDNAGKAMVPTVRGARIFGNLRGTAAWKVAKLLLPMKVRARMIRTLSKPTPRNTDPVELAAVAAKLRPQMLAQTAELGSLLGRAFPEWKTLHGGAAVQHPAETKSRIA